MIEQLVIALSTFANNQQLSEKKREDSYVIVGKSNASSTFISNDLFAKSYGNSLTTYQSVPITITDNSENTSPSVKHSVKVNGLFIVGGRIRQPEIDEEEIVYFDE